MSDSVIQEADYYPSLGQRIKIYTPKDFVHMREAGRLASQTLDYITPHVKPGVTTDTLNTLCHDYILSHGATPAPLDYRGFPKSICTSVNHVVCHGIPGDRILMAPDIINIDVTVIHKGWYGDSSRMYYVGTPKLKARRLCEVTFEALWRGIETVKPGGTFGDIGHAIQSFAEEKGYAVVRNFCGHGIGQSFHEAPHVFHYGSPARGPVLKEGMLFTIEPMINIGTYEVKTLHDGWTTVTKDRSLSAQFEHTIGVTKTGYEVFTLSLEGFNKPPYPV